MEAARSLTLTCTWSRFIAHLLRLGSFDHEGGARRAETRELARGLDGRRSFGAIDPPIASTLEVGFCGICQEVERAHLACGGVFFRMQHKRRAQALGSCRGTHDQGA